MDDSRYIMLLKLDFLRMLNERKKQTEIDIQKENVKAETAFSFLNMKKKWFERKTVK